MNHCNLHIQVSGGHPHTAENIPSINTLLYYSHFIRPLAYPDPYVCVAINDPFEQLTGCEMRRSCFSSLGGGLTTHRDPRPMTDVAGLGWLQQKPQLCGGRRCSLFLLWRPSEARQSQWRTQAAVPEFRCWWHAKTLSPVPGRAAFEGTGKWEGPGLFLGNAFAVIKLGGGWGGEGKDLPHPLYSEGEKISVFTS